jgi:hypothetical protein
MQPIPTLLNLRATTLDKEQQHDDEQYCRNNPDDINVVHTF